jgi:hypothetical protein
MIVPAIHLYIFGWTPSLVLFIFLVLRYQECSGVIKRIVHFSFSIPIEQHLKIIFMGLGFFIGLLYWTLVPFPGIFTCWIIRFSNRFGMRWYAPGSITVSLFSDKNNEVLFFLVLRSRLLADWNLIGLPLFRVTSLNNSEYKMLWYIIMLE